jgi:hypothetical protein
MGPVLLFPSKSQIVACLQYHLMVKLFFDPMFIQDIWPDAELPVTLIPRRPVIYCHLVEQV